MIESYYAVMKAALDSYENALRATGRTTTMIGSLQDNDAVIFAHTQERDRVKKILNKRDHFGRRLYPEKVQVIVAAPTFHDVNLKLCGQEVNKLHFDHQWVEAYYQHNLRKIFTDLQQLQNHPATGRF